MSESDAMAAPAAIAALVADFYDRIPYPPPSDDLAEYGFAWDDARRREDALLFRPNDPYSPDSSILVAGCGTRQAAHYAVRWPDARVVGIDVSSASIAYERALAKKHGLINLELRELPVERAEELCETFDHIVCTGVLHHLADPDAGLRALRDVLAPRGTLHVMVYAPYGRTGIYMLQEYARRLGVAPTENEARDLASTLAALPPDHPLVPLLRNSPDFGTVNGLADALLHPQDRAYSVPQFLEFLSRGGFAFGRWIRQAPYLPWCGAPAGTPHASRLCALAPPEQYAELELLRGTMVRHSAVAYGDAATARRHGAAFEGEDWTNYVPIRASGTIAVRENVPPGSVAVLINRNHTYNDLYLPVDIYEERLWNEIDGARTIAQIANGSNDAERVRNFFQKLWRWDQIVVDTSTNGP